MPEDLWWRAEDKRYANYDPWAEFEQPTGSHLKIEFRSYHVTRYTPKGVWISWGFGHSQFVLGTATKQYAVPTKELALRDLIARKKIHVSSCKARLAQAEEHLTAAQRLLERDFS
jgi:hypothetical protein